MSLEKKNSIFSSKFARMGEEKERWLNITNFNVWQTLKLIEGGRNYIRAIIESFAGSRTTLIYIVNTLVKWGLVSEEREQKRPYKRILKLTEDGVKLLGLLDGIGEIVNKIRKQNLYKPKQAKER